MYLVALVGMAGAGKSEVANFFSQTGYIKIRFGDITEDEVNRRGLVLNEENERRIREGFRQDYGMAAFAILNLPKIDQALNDGHKVVVDGLYSWEEYGVLREHFASQLKILAVYSSPATRYARLGHRTHRPLTSEQAFSRDNAEIENINKGGPIAMADHTIINEGSMTELEACVKYIINKLEQNNGK